MNSAGLMHPGQPTLTVGSGPCSSVSHELTRLPRSPERLEQLSDELVREPHHRQPHDLECCDHRTDPGIGLRCSRPALMASNAITARYLMLVVNSCAKGEFSRRADRATN